MKAHIQRWTTDELFLVGTSDLTDAEIAQRLGRTAHDVRMARYRYDLPSKRRRVPVSADTLRTLLKHNTVMSLAIEFDMTENGLLKFMHRHGLSARAIRREVA